MHRPVNADEADDKSLSPFIADALVCEQVADFEQVARMLPSSYPANLPAYKSAKLTTWMSANPRAALIASNIGLVSGSYTQPRSTRVDDQVAARIRNDKSLATVKGRCMAS